MSNEVSVPITFAQEVTDKVRQLIMNAMPEEKIQAVLKAEYDNYFMGKGDRWGNSSKSQFANLVEHEIKIFVEQRVRTEVSTYLNDLVWGNHGKEYAQTILAEITPVVLDAMAKQTAFTVASAFVNGVQSAMNQNRTY